MNTQTLRKNYGKLTARERYSAILAAAERGDKDELQALKKSAPKYCYNICHHYGIVIAFEGLAKDYIMNQLYLFILGLLLGQAYLRDPDQGDVIWDTLEQVSMGFLTRAEAWRKVCHEYQVNPDFFLKAFPGGHVISRGEDMARTLYDGELKEIETAVDSMRKALENKAAEWE
jgi:hypothetical protein